MHGNCSEHQYRPVTEVMRSIGKVTVELCNNCLSVIVTQRCDGAETVTKVTEIIMEDSAYSYVK